MFPVKIFLSTVFFLTEIFDKEKHLMEYFTETYGCVIKRVKHSQWKTSWIKKRNSASYHFVTNKQQGEE